MSSQIETISAFVEGAPPGEVYLFHPLYKYKLLTNFTFL